MKERPSDIAVQIAGCFYFKTAAGATDTLMLSLTHAL